MKHRTGKDFQTGGGKFLSEPGTYHLMIADVTENPVDKHGKLMSNAAFRATMSTMAGTVEGQEDKIVNLTWWHPTPGDDKADFDVKKIDRFLLATDLIKAGDKESQVEIDVKKAIGRHVVVRLQKPKDSEFLKMNYADIFHIDDPEAASCPKKESVLKLIPASHRKIGGKPAGPPKPGPAQDIASLDL
jgi:hypothetical protein